MITKLDFWLSHLRRPPVNLSPFRTAIALAKATTWRCFQMKGASVLTNQGKNLMTLSHWWRVGVLPRSGRYSASSTSRSAWRCLMEARLYPSRSYPAEKHAKKCEATARRCLVTIRGLTGLTVVKIIFYLLHLQTGRAQTVHYPL